MQHLSHRFPYGNIKLFEAEKIARSRHVKRAIPMALGDAYKSFRIIGTTKAYADLYKAELDHGAWWKDDMEVTIGGNVKGLKLGDSFPAPTDSRSAVMNMMLSSML
jgi:putative ABC transport system permease protein